MVVELANRLGDSKVLLCQHRGTSKQGCERAKKRYERDVPALNLAEGAGSDPVKAA
jgi:hypothetical protein